MNNWTGSHDYCELNLGAIRIEITSVVGGYNANVKFGSLIKPIEGCRTLESAKQQAINYALQVLHGDLHFLKQQFQQVENSMTNEIKGFVVSLEENISPEKAERIKELILEIKGVIGVDLVEASNSADAITESRLKSKLLADIVNLLT